MNKANAYMVKVPAEYLTSSAGNILLRFCIPYGTVEAQSNVIAPDRLEGAATVGLVIKMDTGKKLKKGKMKTNDDIPALEINVQVDRRRIEWSNQSAPLNVSIDYSLQKKSAESLERVMVWYSDGSDSAIELPDGKYHRESGTVSFTANYTGFYDVDLIFSKK